MSESLNFLATVSSGRVWSVEKLTGRNRIQSSGFSTWMVEPSGRKILALVLTVSAVSAFVSIMAAVPVLKAEAVAAAASVTTDVTTWENLKLFELLE